MGFKNEKLEINNLINELSENDTRDMLIKYLSDEVDELKDIVTILARTNQKQIEEIDKLSSMMVRILDLIK